MSGENGKESEVFDLTTTEGIKVALDKYGKGIALGAFALSPPLGIAIFGYKLAKDLIDWVKETTDIVAPLKEQAAAAETIIKAGRESGVDEIEIELDQNVGLNLDTILKGDTFKTTVGKSGKMKLKVKYK